MGAAPAQLLKTLTNPTYSMENEFEQISPGNSTNKFTRCNKKRIFRRNVSMLRIHSEEISHFLVI